MHKNVFAETTGVEKSITQHWFAVRVKSRYEKTVATIAHNKGFEEFLPLYRNRRRWSDRVKSVELPLFPGYVFCRLDPQYRLPLLTIPGVLHFVGIGKTPIPIEESEIAAIQAAVQSGLYLEPWDYLEVGQRVLLQEGPLAGMDGIFVGTSRQERIVVSVALLKRSVAVAIERHWAIPLDGVGRPITLPVRPFVNQTPHLPVPALANQTPA
jgi:transcription antitermination factor NusG